MKTNKSGISLIVLVITIIVLAILATTVIISLSNTNIIEEASNAIFKSDMKNYQSMLSVYIADETLNNASTGGLELSGVNVVNGDDTYTKIFGDNVPAKYADKLMVSKGKLVFVTTDANEQSILDEIGISYVMPTQESWFTECTYVDEYGTTKECFDEATGTLYSVNLPEGVTEVTIPETINGVKVKQISTPWYMIGQSKTYMPITITKVYLPAGIILNTGAFSDNTTDTPLTPEIEVIAAGPIVIYAGDGPVLNLSPNSSITLADGSYFDASGYMGLDRKNVNFGTGTVTFGFNTLAGFIENFKVSDGVYQVPKNIVFEGETYLSYYDKNMTIYMTQTQFNAIVEFDSLQYTVVSTGKYQITVDGMGNAITEVYIQIW